jgi:hypothetical protein
MDNSCQLQLRGTNFVHLIGSRATSVMKTTCEKNPDPETIALGERSWDQFYKTAILQFASSIFGHFCRQKQCM